MKLNTISEFDSWVSKKKIVFFLCRRTRLPSLPVASAFSNKHPLRWYHSSYVDYVDTAKSRCRLEQPEICGCELYC